MNRKWAQEVALKCVQAIYQDDQEALWQVLNPILDVKVAFPFLMK